MPTKPDVSLRDRVFTLEELDDVMAHPFKSKELPEHFEVVEGRMVETSPTKDFHGFTAGDVAGVLGGYVKAKRLGKVSVAELGFKLKADPLTIRCPDVAFVRKERVTKRGEYIEGGPDLAIEVVSPSNSPGEINAKTAEYLDAGSKLVWIVYPETGEVHVYRPGSLAAATVLKNQDEITGEDVIPGFSCKVSEFFEEV